MAPLHENLTARDLRREHWTVPVRGLTSAHPDGVVHAVAHPDGTVSLHLQCGSTRTGIQLDISRAAQLSAGIWEAAGAAQQLTIRCGRHQPPLPSPAPESRPGGGRSPDIARLRKRHRRPAVHDAAVQDAIRALGLRLRRIRTARNKSLRVVSGLAGMSSSTLHRIEHGRCAPTLYDLVALARALQVAPAALIQLPGLSRTPEVR